MWLTKDKQTIHKGEHAYKLINVRAKYVIIHTVNVVTHWSEKHRIYITPMRSYGEKYTCSNGPKRVAMQLNVSCVIYIVYMQLKFQ